MIKFATLHVDRETIESIIADAIDSPPSMVRENVSIRVVWKYDDAGWLDGADIECYEDQANNPNGSK